MHLRRLRLPRGRHFAVTWNIPDDFGGMTTALLRRCRAFVTLGGASVDVLTFAVRSDWAAVEERLRQRGDLIDGVRLLNLWAWLGSTSHRERRDGEGRLLQVDHYRADGSLAVSDRRDVLSAGTHGGRLVTQYGPDGSPLRSWGKAWDLYHWWLDELADGERSWLIVDSKTSANFMVGYRRPTAVVAHVIHNSHLTAAGDLRPSRRRVLRRLGSLDLAVLLTERQRADIAAQVGDQGTLEVIPNPHDVRPERGERADHGVVLASLTARKRVDLAVRAAARAGARLEVFGDGERREALERLVAELGVGGRVRLRGHRADARDELGTASFALLTGASEGFPLVLVEAMAAGCIPIALDVPYGAADVIRHRRNGYLATSVDELAAAITELHSLSPRRVARMRRAAQRTAGRYSDAAAVRRWSRALRRAAR